MESKIGLEPLSEATFATYCKIGEQAYRDHYLHLWPGEDPSPYIENSFKKRVLRKEINDQNTFHFIIRKGSEAIGILKLIRKKGVKDLPQKDAMLLEKIYLLNKFTGQGFGKQILKQTETMALNLQARYIWLATMQKGRALSFYQDLGYAIIGDQKLPFENAREEEKGMFLLVKELFHSTI
jgi:GNAT superfamily N-acetyltransferase